MKKFALCWLLMLPVLLAGCDEVKLDDFGGIHGTVGYPPVRHCSVEIYDGTAWESLDSTRGLIDTVRTNGRGQFDLELPDKHLGKPLIIVARPDAQAEYLDFGATGNPWVPFDSTRQPWVSVVDEFRGGDDLVTVNPMTTAAFFAQLNLSAYEYGIGVLNFDRKISAQTSSGIANSFGIPDSVYGHLPAPPEGGPFPKIKARDVETEDRNTSYTYACLQLAVAANTFATTVGSGDALAFYEAMIDDARDGVIDGQTFGVNQPYLTLGGAPDVVGFDADGSAKFFEWLASEPLSATDQQFAGEFWDQTFKPSPTEMLAAQGIATGAVRPVRIDSYDVVNMPWSGSVEMTVRGAGFRHSDRLVIRSRSDRFAYFYVDSDSVGVDGQVQHHSPTEWVVRLPDLALTTEVVKSNLNPASGDNFRSVNFILEVRPSLEGSNRDIEILITDQGKLTKRTEPLLVGARVGRVDASGDLTETNSGNNVYPAATDPATLTPGTDDVYELRVKVANPSPDDITGLALDLTNSTFEQLGTPVVADTFGGAAVGRAIIFENPLPSTTLLAGDDTELVYRFTFLDSAIPADLTMGVPVEIFPVLSGTTIAGTVTTNDITDFTPTLAMAPVEPDNTPVLGALAAPTVPATVTAGDSFDVQMSLGATPRTSAPMRTGLIESIDVTITFNGTTTVHRLTAGHTLIPAQGGLMLVSVTLQGGGVGLPLSLSNLDPSKTLVLSVQTASTPTGALSVGFVATLRDVATGTTNSETSGNSNVTINP